MRGTERSAAALTALGMAFALTPAAAAQTTGFELDKAVYAAGEVVTVTATLQAGCEKSPVTSPGFKAPIRFTATSGLPRMWSGRGNAVDRPGTYTARGTCNGEVVTRTFKVKGIPATPPKPKIVKPQGAPDTGGGGTAMKMITVRPRPHWTSN